MNAKIVAFDLSPNILKLYTIVLQAHHYDVLGFLETLTSTEQVTSYQPNLIILGSIRGYLPTELDVLRLLRACPTTAHLPILISTANAWLVREWLKSTSLSNIIVMEEPFDVQTLLSNVERLLRGLKKQIINNGHLLLIKNAYFDKIVAGESSLLTHPELWSDTIQKGRNLVHLYPGREMKCEAYSEAERGRREAEHKRAQAEAARETAEMQRAADEQQRQLAEEMRETAEQARTSIEAIAEPTRQMLEEMRTSINDLQSLVNELLHQLSETPPSRS